MKPRKKGKNWISLSIVLSIVVIFIFLDIKAPSFLEVLELKTLDYRFRIRGGRETGREVAIVIIDEQSIQEIDRWPWKRDTMARLVDLLSIGGAKVIGFDIIFSEPERSDSLKTIRRLKDEYRSSGKFDERVLEILRQEEGKADTDHIFSRSIEKAGVVVMPIAFHVSADFEKEGRDPVKNVSEGMEASSYLLVKNLGASRLFRPVESTDYLPPLDQLIRSSNSLGHVYTLPDRDGVLRWEFLSLKYGDAFYPAFGIQVVMEYLGLKREDMKLILGEGVQIGEIKVPTDEWGRFLISYNGPARTFPYYRAADILMGKITPEEFRGRIVLIGTTIIGVHDQWMTPFPILMPGVEKHANVIENILHQNFLHRTERMKIIDIAFILLFAGLLLFALPRLRALTGAAITLMMLVGYMVLLQIVFNKAGLWIHFLYPSSTILLTYTSITVLRFMTEERRAREVRAIFSSYVTPKVMEMLVANPEMTKLGGQRKEITVLFSDIRGFTRFSENHQPEEVVATLNEYMQAMTEVIFHWDGTLDKFVGDAIMVFWGAPLDQSNHTELAVRCALHMQQRLAELQETWRAQGKEVLDAGIGINTGEMLVGNIGAEGKKMDYTVIGDHVNLGARVESLTRQYNARILITEYTFGKIKHLLQTQEVSPNNRRQKAAKITHPDRRKKPMLAHAAFKDRDRVQVKGRERPVRIFEVIGYQRKDHEN